jgi:hypothetical protein
MVRAAYTAAVQLRIARPARERQRPVAAMPDDARATSAAGSAAGSAAAPEVDLRRRSRNPR